MNLPERHRRISTAESTALRKRWRALFQLCIKSGISAPRRILQRAMDMATGSFTTMTDPLGPDITADRAALFATSMDKLEAMAREKAAQPKATPGLRYTR